MSQVESLEHIAQVSKGTSVPSKTYFPYSSGLVSSAIQFEEVAPLLIIQAPGWGIGSPYLQTGFSLLESHFTLLYVEPRGSCNSVRPDEAAMTTLQMIEDLERLRLFLGLEKMNILGHSHGGIISLGYASRYPERVEKMVLVVHALQGYDDSAEWKRLAEKRKGDERPVLQKDSYCFADPVTYHEAFLKTVPNPLSLWTWNALGAGDKVEKFEQEKELASVKATTLIIGAMEDPLGSANVSRITQAGIEGSEMVVLEECGHFPWVEQSGKFFEALLAFFPKNC